MCDAKAYDAEKEATHKVTVENTVSIDPTCGAFINMNPGYLGRSELPEGLKALFRPITVIVPDLVLICENMLMAEGFLTAKMLASKFYGLQDVALGAAFQTSSLRLGSACGQVCAGGGWYAEKSRARPCRGCLLMRALRDFNIPKIVQADEVVFGLLNDLFQSSTLLVYSMRNYLTVSQWRVKMQDCGLTLLLSQSHAAG